NLAGILNSVDDEDEPRTWQWNDTAGKVINKHKTVYERWESILKSKGQQELSSGTTTHDDNLDQKCYHPFASQLDWEIAQWAVTEKISQKGLDRLLNVPQVQQKLGLSYENSRGMLKCIDEIPERCGKWRTKQLTFRDKPGEHFTVYHRDPVEAIKALWGDPAFAEHLVYKPGKLFRGAEQTENNRIYSEMWT
ncbi:hypothetical protein BDP27DRAFT_1149834, partial [Rhodocollybia butyracea]